MKANIITDIINNSEEGFNTSVSLIGDSYISTLNVPKSYRWYPKEDITTFELALCVPVLLSLHSVIAEYAIDRLPEFARRHFTEC
jgi:hypothetical protein